MRRLRCGRGLRGSLREYLLYRVALILARRVGHTVGAVGGIAHAVRLGVLPDHETLFLTGGKHQRVEQIAQGIAVGHPCLTHAEHIAYAQSAALAYIVVMQPQIALEAIHIDGRAHRFALAGGARHGEPLQKIVAERARRCRVRVKIYGIGSFLALQTHARKTVLLSHRCLETGVVEGEWLGVEVAHHGHSAVGGLRGRRVGYDFLSRFCHFLLSVGIAEGEGERRTEIVLLRHAYLEASVGIGIRLHGLLYGGEVAGRGEEARKLYQHAFQGVALPVARHFHASGNHLRESACVFHVKCLDGLGYCREGSDGIRPGF